MTYFDKQLEKLEKEQRELAKRTAEGNIDRYNQPESQYEIQDFKDLVQSKIEFAPRQGESWSDYAQQVKVYAKMNAKKNWLTHVDNPYKVWRTHRLPLGCFMCEDTNLISVLVRVICLMASKYKDNKF